MLCYHNHKNRPSVVATFTLASVAALAAVALPSGADAQTPAAPAGTPLPEIAVSASRVEEDVRDVPATISTIDSRDIDRNLVRSMQDLIRYEPGVSVSSDPNRFGASSFNIRGLDGNRVVMQVDGIRAPSLFQFGIGPFNTSTRNFVDMDSLKRVEILRGPASTLYGSDALGGVVSYITKDPLDYLELARSPFYGALKSGYSSADDGWANTATLAAGTDRVQGMLLYTYFTGSELDNMGEVGGTGPTRTEPNPQDIRQSNLLGKITWAIDSRNSLRAVYERFTRDAEVDVLSLNASTPRTSSITGDDDSERERYSLDYAYRNSAGGWVAGVTANIYQQVSHTRSLSSETRRLTSATCSGTAVGVSTCLIPREFDFQQRLTGGSAQLESLVELGGVPNRIVWGAEYSETTSSGLRNALIINQTLGTVTNMLAGDAFPARDFPNTDTREIGIYVQDQISLLNDRLIITPALRYDDYDMSVKPDAIYLANTPPGVRAQDFSDSAVSPKLAAMYRIDENLNVYGQYAFGFRAPPFDTVNAAFRNPVQSYVLVPNPNLESETSQGMELGLKGAYGRSSFAVAAFYNRYKDFIEETVMLNCPGDPACVPNFFITFQPRNVSRVRIYGAEAKGEWAFLDNWSVAGSVAYANGEDTDTNEPLNSINPLTGVIGLHYTASGGEYGAALNVTAVSRKRGSDISEPANTTLFAPGGFATVDITAFWNINRHARIAAGVFNLLDKKYWLWGNVYGTGLAASSPSVDRYTQPGLNAAVNLQLIY